ncbi:MAG: RHS repeat domain-containing protein, partial [Leadbetterella sp.]
LVKAYDYLAGMVYQETTTGKELDFVASPEGRALLTKKVLNLPADPTSGNKFKYEYSLKDHLGNLRVSCRCNEPKRDAQGVIIPAGQPGAGVDLVGVVQEQHYDAWGLAFGSDAVTPSVVEGNKDRFQYNGKELLTDLDLGWNDYGARMYDATIGRWSAVDPLAEVSRRWSPYAYCYNNPLIFVDPDGMMAQTIYDFDGNAHEINDDDVENIYKSEDNNRNSSKDVQQSNNSGVDPVNNNNKKNISTSSYGETAGLYPIKTEKDAKGNVIKPKNKDLFNPKTWDPHLLNQLLKARAAITLLSERGAKLHNDSPDLNDPTEKLLAAYHLKNNFPVVDPEIKDDPEVMFFYLSPNKNIKTPSISPKYWDQKTVKAYGPFYSIGGGDAGTGPIYIIFYKPIKKN